MAMRQLGWTWPRFDCFITRQGLQLWLQDVCPEDVKAMARLDSDAAMWERWTAAEEYATLAPRPLVEPVARLLAACPGNGWTAQHRNAVSGMVQSAHWTQSR